MSTVGKDDNWMTQKRLNSVFATAQLGYREGIFLDISARNDWSSALAFTESCSFFYPSFGGSVLLNKFVDMGKNIDLFKFRASYSIVGNDVPVFMSNLLYSLGSQGAITPPRQSSIQNIEAGKNPFFRNWF